MTFKQKPVLFVLLVFNKDLKIKKKSKTPYLSTVNTLRTGKKEKKETRTAQYRQSVRLQSMRKMYTVLQVTSKRRDGNEV